MRWTPSTRRVILIYLAFGCVWIIASDWILGSFIHDAAELQEWQGYKGVAFVVATAVLLHGLLSYHDRQLAQSEARARLFIKHAPAALAMFDRDMRFMEVSDRWISDFSLEPGSQLLGRNHYEVNPDIPQRWREVHQRALRGATMRKSEDYFVRADGRARWQQWEARPWYRPDQSIGGIMIFAEELTSQKEAEKELRVAAKAFETRQATFITDADQQILRVNTAFCDTTGYAPEEVIGKTPAVLRSGRHGEGFYRELWRQLSETGEWQGEIWNRRKDGRVFPQWLHISTVLDERGFVTHYIAACEDLSTRKEAEEQIHNLSYYDVLTKLPNRRLLIDRLSQSLLSSARSKRYGAVFFIDLDNFSALNDTRGHDTGDKVLGEVARNLSAAVRGDDTVARLGGDEFVIVAENLEVARDAALVQSKEIGESLLAAIRRPLSIDGQAYAITASMGISLFNEQDDSVKELLKRADAAMVQVRRIGRDCLHFFDADMQEMLQKRVELEALLRDAIPDQLELYYQPQVDARGQVLGTEALIRWHSPDRGVVPPADFIPLAEDSGLILPMGQWILGQACEQLAQWRVAPGREHLTLSVNVSPKQYQHGNFVASVTEALERTGANPAQLKLEITESTLFEDLEGVTYKMKQLQALGIRFSLDDFGTGFSSLGYLKQLPVDELKIDKSFVRALDSDRDNLAIVRTIITLGRSLNLQVIAEGVESDADRTCLLRNGCDRFQGYHFAKPMAVDLLEDYLQQSLSPTS